MLLLLPDIMICPLTTRPEATAASSWESLLPGWWGWIPCLVPCLLWKTSTVASDWRSLDHEPVLQLQSFWESDYLVSILERHELMRWDVPKHRSGKESKNVEQPWRVTDIHCWVSEWSRPTPLTSVTPRGAASLLTGDAWTDLEQRKWLLEYSHLTQMGHGFGLGLWANQQ